MPTARIEATDAYIRLPSLGATAMSAWTIPPGPSPPSVPAVGNPLVSGFHVLPPSIDLKMPPLVPLHAPFSHGPWRVSQRHAYTISGFFGSNSTSDAPVFSSR